MLALTASCGPDPDPARENVVACHRQIMKSELHSADAIIEVAEHRRMLACMASRKFIFQAEAATCAARVIEVDNPACYHREN